MYVIDKLRVKDPILYTYRHYGEIVFLRGPVSGIIHFIGYNQAIGQATKKMRYLAPRLEF